MADKTEQDVYEEDPLALSRAYGVEPVDPDETVKAAKDVGQFVLESLPGVGTAFTVAEIEDELKKEDPNYLKIGMLAGTEAIGLIPGLGTAAKNMIRKGADMARQTDEVMVVASSVPKISRKSTPSYTDADLLEADEIISEWGKGNLTNPELRSKLRDKGFNVETKRISPKMTGDDLEFVGPDGNIVRWKDMPRGQNRTPQMSNEDYDIRMAALDEIEDIEEWQKAAKKEIKTGRVADPAIKTPELEESTRLLLDNKITREEHLANVDKYKPVNPWDALPREPSNKAVVFSLNDKQRQDGFFVLDNAAEMGVNKSSLKIGDLFNGRLDIPAYNRYDTWIVTGSSKNAEKGKHYAKAIHYRSGEGEPVKFIASEKTSERIGTGEIDKTPYATVQGYIEDLDADAIRAKAAEYLNDPEWTQVGFDPRRQGGFYVRAGENKHVPVREATEVIQIGPLILAKNAKLDFDYEGYSEGGTVMNKQMEMAFMQEGGITDDGMNVDPVSGNEVPPGSLAKEVRDDIPAQLSEGEYVVPADVVRYYGVRFFEDLRDQAKMGLADMEANGRIGGEPVPEGGPKMDGGLSDAEKAAVQEIMSGMSQGGMARGYAPGGGVAPATNVPTMTPTQLTQPTQYTQPNYSFLSPSTSQVQQPKVEQPPEQPQVEVKLWPPGGGDPLTFQSPKDDVAIKDLEMQGYTRSPQTSSNDDGGGTPPPPTGGGKGLSLGFKNWGEEVDWSDPDAIMKFVNASREGLIDPKTGSKLTQVGVALGGPGLGTLAGVAGSVPTMQSVSDMRAAAIVARAQGMDSVAAQIDGQIEEVMKNASGFTNFIDKFFGEAMDGDAKGKSALNKLGLQYDEDDNGNPTYSAQQIAANKTKMGGGAKPPVESKDEDPFKDLENARKARQKAGKEALKTSSTATNVQVGKAAARGASQAEQQKIREEGAKVEKQLESMASGKNTTGQVGFNKGGLMTKGKKKK